MKTDFSVNVQVNIGVTPEVVQLATAILTGKQPTAIAAPAASEQPKPEPQPQAAAKKGKGKKNQPEAEAPAESEESAAAETSETVTDQPEETPADDPNRQLTEEDVREAMHKTRQRIEGENYKENTDSEAYKKYHKVLTQEFKNISALLGSDKPSTLPEDKRADFIAECNALQIQKDGSIGKTLTF